jgi:hypothetical protein
VPFDTMTILLITAENAAAIDIAHAACNLSPIDMSSGGTRGNSWTWTTPTRRSLLLRPPCTGAATRKLVASSGCSLPRGCICRTSA